MKPPILLALGILIPSLLSAQPGPEELEARLIYAKGPERLELLVELTTAYREADAARALRLGDEALAMLGEAPDQRQRLEVLNSLSHAHIVLGDYEPALELAVRSEQLARAIGDDSGRALAFRNIGRVRRSLSEYPAALEAYGQAAELWADTGESAPHGDALNDIGIVHWYRGDYALALDYFIRARKEYEEADDPQRIAAILNNTGMIHRRLEQPERALELYQEALELRRRVGPPGAISNVLNNIGNVYRDMGEPARAIETYREALEVGPRDRQGHVNTITNIGVAYEDLGDFDRALEHYIQVIDARKQLGDKQGHGYALSRLASIQRRQGEPETAIETLQEALSILQEIEAKDELKEAHLELSKTYADLGRFRDAFESFQRYEQVKSNIFKENSRTIAEMEASFESERKEKEIEILKQKQAIATLEYRRQAVVRRAIYGGLALLSLLALVLYNRSRLRARSERLIQRQKLELANERIRQEERERYVTELEVKNAEIEARNAEMERFTYTVSHDLKSPLVTISGFLDLVRREALKGDTERLTRDLAQIEAATRHMARLLDDSLKLSQVGRVVNEPKQIPMAQLARQAVDLVAQQIADGGAEVSIASDLPVVFGDHPRLLEVLQNLIENAVKFMGDQPQPRVEVGARETDGETVFFVRDNGSGIAPRFHQTIFGLFDRLDQNVDGTGVGLALVQRIVEVHGGRLWVESDGEGRGSTFCFTLPWPPDLQEARQAEAAG